MRSARLPRESTPNTLTRLLETKRRAGEVVLDLTITNPTRVGLPGMDPQARRLLSDPRCGTYYPDPKGIRPAREAIAEDYAALGLSVDPESLVLTAGTSESYAHLFRLLCDPGDEVMVPRPSYPLLEPIASLESVILRSYRLRRGARWSLDLDSVEAAITARTRAIVVVEPNNPTGSSLSVEERSAVESVAEVRGLAVVSDEVFREFPWDGAGVASWAGARRAVTFVLDGISKRCGLPQLKLGWIAVFGPESRRRDALDGLEWIADLFLSVGAPVQVALRALLAGRGAFQEAARERLARNLRALGAKAQARDGRVELAVHLEGERVGSGQGGFSVVAYVRRSAAAQERREAAEWLLDARNVLGHPGHYYDLCDGDAIVLSLLSRPEHWDEGLERIARG